MGRRGSYITGEAAEANKMIRQFECGTRMLCVIHGRDARATPEHCTSPGQTGVIDRDSK